MIKASIDTLIPVCEKLFNSIRNQGTMPQTWCGGLIIHGADEAIRQKIPVYLCLQLPGKTILFYLKQSGISLNLRTEPTGHAPLFNQ